MLIYRHVGRILPLRRRIHLSHFTTLNGIEKLQTFGPEFGEKIFSDIKKIPNLEPRRFREFMESLTNTRIGDLTVWSKCSAYCIENAHRFKYMDMTIILDCFERMKMADSTVLITFAPFLIRFCPLMEPRHFIVIMNAYYFGDKIHKALFSEIFYQICRKAESYYANEYVELLSCLVKLEIENKDLLEALSKAITRNLCDLRYIHISQIVASFRKLKVADDVFYYLLDNWQKKELMCMTLQELFDTFTTLKQTELAWEVYTEELENELAKRTKSVVGEEDIDQLSDPFDALSILQMNNLLSVEFLRAMAKWCARAVYRPPTRSQKRPLSNQLVHLCDLFKSFGVEEDKYLNKAILKFVTSEGGLKIEPRKSIPVIYKKGRKYIRAPDPMATPTQNVVSASTI